MSIQVAQVFASAAAFPLEGHPYLLYKAADTGLFYHWDRINKKYIVHVESPEGFRLVERAMGDADGLSFENYFSTGALPDIPAGTLDSASAPLKALIANMRAVGMMVGVKSPAPTPTGVFNHLTQTMTVPNTHGPVEWQITHSSAVWGSGDGPVLSKTGVFKLTTPLEWSDVQVGEYRISYRYVGDGGWTTHASSIAVFKPEVGVKPVGIGSSEQFYLDPYDPADAEAYEMAIHTGDYEPIIVGEGGVISTPHKDIYHHIRRRATIDALASEQLSYSWS